MKSLKFENPQNGHVEDCPMVALWTFLCGPFYFGYKGLWGWVALSILLGIFTAGISWFVLPLFAPEILEKHFLQRGWRKIEIEEPLDVEIPRPKRSAKAEAEHQRKLAEAKRKMGW